MMVPPLSERPVTDEDEEQFRAESTPRKYTLRRRWADYRAEVKARRPKGVRARARAWLHVEPFYWGMRVVYVALFAGAVFAVYINGVAEGWWPAWGERPTVAATTTAPVNPAPTSSATASGEAAMSGGYQIGPDGVLVRPAEHAASTYTKPELPEEAAVSMGGSNEFVECFCWGAVAEGGSGAVVQFVGDGVEVGLVAGDGGSFGQVAADEPVGVFVGSSLPGAVGVSEEHVHAGVVGEALVAGHFPALVPGQCAHRPFGQALDAAGERVTDLVCFPPQGQGDDDQVAGRALDQGRCSRWPRLGR